jgi:hypothetical protein
VSGPTSIFSTTLRLLSDSGKWHHALTLARGRGCYCRGGTLPLATCCIKARLGKRAETLRLLVLGPLSRLHINYLVRQLIQRLLVITLLATTTTNYNSDKLMTKAAISSTMIIDVNELTIPGFGLPLSLLAPPHAEGCNLETLIDDILIGIVGVLSVRDILNVRLVSTKRSTPTRALPDTMAQTSKRLSTITRLRAVWHAVFHREVVARGRPVPGIPYPLCDNTLESSFDSKLESTFAPSALEHHTHLAMRLAKRWARPRPASSQSFRVSLRDAFHGRKPRAEMGEIEEAFLLYGGTRIVTVHQDVLALWAMSVPGIQVAPPLLSARFLAARHVAGGCSAILDAAHRSDGYCGEKAGAGSCVRMALSAKQRYGTPRSIVLDITAS